MDAATVCVACGECAVICDPISALVACEACGFINDDGPILVSGQAAEFIAGSGWKFSTNSALLPGMQTYHPAQWSEKKKRLAMQSVEHVTSVLRFAPDKVDEVKHFLGLFFETGYGVGRWVEIAVGACAYIVIRQNRFPLTLLEVAEVVSCSVPELGRMFQRVVNALQIELPEINTSIFLERAIMSLPVFELLPKSGKRDLLQHALLLLDYAEEWSISSGRHVLPVLAAILVLLGDVNQMKTASIQISRELHASQASTSVRIKELKDALIDFAQVLPWGKDINVKNLHRHMPFLLQYLDIRRKLKRNGAQPGQKTEDRPLPLREVMVSTRKQFGDFGPNSNPGVLQDDGSRSPRNEASQKALPREGATDSSEVQCRKRGSDSNPNLPRDKGNKCPRTKACDTPGNNAEVQKRLVMREHGCRKQALPRSAVK